MGHCIIKFYDNIKAWKILYNPIRFTVYDIQYCPVCKRLSVCINKCMGLKMIVFKKTCTMILQNNYFKTPNICSVGTLNDPEHSQSIPKNVGHVHDCSAFLLEINYEITWTLFGLVQNSVHAIISSCQEDRVIQIMVTTIKSWSTL